jgi:hypothetical protein
LSLCGIYSHKATLHINEKENKKMANIPAQLYRGDSDYLGTISNVDGQILFDTDKKEIFMDDGTTRESYGGGAGDKKYDTLAQAQADIANISDTDTVFVKEGTSASLTQRVDDLETEVTEISSDLSYTVGTETVVGKFGSENVYRKSYRVTGLNQASSIMVDAMLTPTYVKSIINVKGSAKNSYGTILPLQFALDSTNRTDIVCDASGLVMEIFGQTITEYTVIIDYLKN